MDNPPQLRTDTPFEIPYGPEHDACAIYISVRKQGQSTHGTLRRALSALARMGHRTGMVNGEGDGAGVQTDLPRQLWSQWLSQAGLRSSLATDPQFWVGHCFIAPDADLPTLRDRLSQIMNEAGLNLLLEKRGRTRASALGPQARLEMPVFWQIAGYAEGDNVPARLLTAQRQIESTLPISFSSLSTSSVVYRVRGAVETLPQFYPDLQDRQYDTAIALCHARYSTNTASSFERVQPFAVLGHNGEINTINRFREEAAKLGILLDPFNSDSQDVDRVVHTLCAEYGLSLTEALELVFPPTPHEVEQFPPALRRVYTRLRHTFGPYAQGPAAIVARYQDEIVCSVDALGLRPLWFVETEKEYVLSSERGVVPLDVIASDTRPLGPGEKVALYLDRGRGVKVLEHREIRESLAARLPAWGLLDPEESPWTGGPPRSNGMPPSPPTPSGGRAPASQPAPVATAVADAPEPALTSARIAPQPLPWHGPSVRPVNTIVLAAAGWNREHIQEIETLAGTGKDPVGSLGHDGPLAVLSADRVNLADFCKETVAVVTNPAIDREREAEAFSTRTLLGVRPELHESPDPEHLLIELETPLLTGGLPDAYPVDTGAQVAEQLGTLSIEAVIRHFAGRLAWLSLGVAPDETVQIALDRLGETAVQAVLGGAQCLILDDAEALQQGAGWLDPHLAVATVNQALIDAEARPNLRRRTGLIVRSASIRNLHDIILLLGVGADAVNPYAMLVAAADGHKTGASSYTPDEIITAHSHLLRALTAGLQKVISTIGCHELRGYGRIFSAIGLAPEIAARLQIPNYFGSDRVGLTWERLNAEAAQRGAELRGEANARLAGVTRFYPRFYKKAQAVAQGEMSADEFASAYRALTEQTPVALRHVLGFKPSSTPLAPEDVDLRVGPHDLPLLISAMSFGSQGELAYRAYASAAHRLNIVCINGEGGELPELLGQHPLNRGQQVASGRFGVNARFLNSAWVIEIKIGQGAKPGEGGMLPAAKVTPQVAAARRTTPFVPLISPSNNHDIYSIEDLAQLIEELKTVNPQARISVKIPVVPGVGVIAVGIAKAGADIIDLTGYDGATGAARRHALQYVGLPTEIGVIQAHRALVEAGLRHRIEIWCDGGMKSGADAVKMILLGANRVGFATMAMVAVGCTICRKCHEGTCHVGITTHIRTVEEAKERGLKQFVPRDYDRAVEGIERVFSAIAAEMRQIAADLGARRLQDLVGRADLLEQVACHDRVDLSAALVPVQQRPRPASEPGVGRRLTRPRNNLTRTISDEIMRVVAEGEQEITYQDEVMAQDRVLGSHLAGELVRSPGAYARLEAIHLRFGPSAVGGNGFAAWSTDKIDTLIEGGAQDGAAKGTDGGRVAVMKGLNHEGMRLDGSVGKSFAYGAQRGVLIVQGDADSRACIRLSGADVIFGGEIQRPIDDSAGVYSTTANLKGFACEYMTSGRVLIMGDPGPYAFAGMTGGVVYQRLTPEMGFTVAALQRRIARGAKVTIQPVDDADVAQIQELLGHYIRALEETDQIGAANRIRAEAQPDCVQTRFVKIVPAIKS
ncbi:MAG: glutamate synthase-related protein [Anaerolineae bacterium]